jgi:SAM-dependent methyltransferase
MNWRDYWNQDTPIYVSDRHKTLHYQRIADDIAALIPHPEAAVLDHGCGEALSAGRVAARCGRLVLCDGAPSLRDRLEERFGANPKVRVIAPEELPGEPDGAFDLIVANSLLQYLSLDELRSLLALWRTKLKENGRLILADVIPPDLAALTDARALLGFAWRGGFLSRAVLGLARTALSDYRKLRDEIGLSTYSEEELIEILQGSGYSARRRHPNFGHNQARMCFEAMPA